MIGALERAQGQTGRPFCQLGRCAEHGAEETPRHCRVDDHAFGGWRCPLFASKQHGSAESWWKRPGWQCPLGPSCYCPSTEEEPEPNQPRHSWQQKATRQLETRFVSDVVWPGLTDARRAWLRSQHGPLASAALTALPSSRATRIVSLFGSSFAADSICLSSCLTAPADVAANLTCLASIAQRAQRQGCGEAWVSA